MLSINEKRKLNASDDIFKILSDFKKDNNYSSLDKEKQKLISQLGFPNQIVIDKIKKAKDTKKLLGIWDAMKKKSFLNYNVDIKKFDEIINEFKKLPFIKQQRTLFDLLNKNQLYVNSSEIKDKEFKINLSDAKLNKEFYD